MHIASDTEKNIYYFVLLAPVTLFHGTRTICWYMLLKVAYIVCAHSIYMQYIKSFDTYTDYGTLYVSIISYKKYIWYLIHINDHYIFHALASLAQHSHITLNTFMISLLLKLSISTYKLADSLLGRS